MTSAFSKRNILYPEFIAFLNSAFNVKTWFVGVQRFPRGLGSGCSVGLADSLVAVSTPISSTAFYQKTSVFYLVGLKRWLSG